MGLAMDTVGGAVTEAGAASWVAVTPAAGDSFTVRPPAAGGMAFLEALARGGAHAGGIRVRSPLMHDDVQGSRFALPTGLQPALGLLNFATDLVGQDTLILECTGTAADVDAADIFLYYTDIAGVNARLAMPGDIAGRIRSVLGLIVAVTASATVGAWADAAITVTEDILHANTDYACLGMLSDTALLGLALRGVDTGNLRCGMPGMLDNQESQHYFVELSEKTGRPHIPIFNSGNKNATYVSVNNNAAGTTANVNLVLCELSPA